MSTEGDEHLNRTRQIGSVRQRQPWRSRPRPARRAETRYLRAITDRVTVAEWERVVDRAVVDAQDGDARARDWLARYLLDAALDPDVIEMVMGINEQST